MKMVKGLSDTIGPLLAADNDTLGPTPANKVALITVNFTPDMDATFGDFTLGAGNGLDPIAGVVGAQLDSIDPITGEIIVEIISPLGGWRWETTGGFTGPTTVFGFLLINDAADDWFGVEKLETPVTLTAPGQSITAPALEFHIDPTKVY